MSKRFAAILSVLFAAVGFAAPQQEAPKPAATTTTAAQAVPDGGMPSWVRPETPEQRKTRLGTPEDPGLDPDLKRIWGRFGHPMHISKYERRLAVYDTGDETTVRPLGMVNFAYEIYQQNAKYVWVWIPEMPPPEKLAELLQPPVTMNEATANYWKSVRPQFVSLTPPAGKKVVRFQEASDGLPVGGSWRSALAAADMNEDGFLDIIAPPERGGRSTTLPSIFLGDGKGHWKLWEAVQWPRSLDYGSVTAADLNKDGHMDLAFGVHLRGVYVFLGDGKGHFTSSDEGLPHKFPTRRVVVSDIDRDGNPDLVALSEGPAAIMSAGGRLRAYLNRDKAKRWEEYEIADPSLQIGGDWLSIADMNGDSLPDFIASCVFQGSNQIVHLSEGKNKWKFVFSANDDVLPLSSIYTANTAGNFSSKKRADAIISYTRVWESSVDPRVVPQPPLITVSNIDRLTYTDKGLKREPIVRWGSNLAVSGMATGDFDGDGNDDVIYTRFDPRDARILLGDGKGGFTEVGVAGMELLQNMNFDVKVADVNGDKRPDVIVMFETSGMTALSDRDGAIRVFLNRGAEAVSTTKTAAQ